MPLVKDVGPNCVQLRNGRTINVRDDGVEEETEMKYAFQAKMKKMEACDGEIVHDR